MSYAQVELTDQQIIHIDMYSNAFKSQFKLPGLIADFINGIGL